MKTNIPLLSTRMIQKNSGVQARYLSQAAQLEEAVNPHILRSTMSIISLAILAFLIWSAFTSINEIARTPGEVVPLGHQQSVQHLYGGMIKQINVREGDTVAKGDVLLTLDEGGVQQDLQRVYNKQLALLMQQERLRAFTENREPDFSRFTQASDKMKREHDSYYDGMTQARLKEAEILKDQIHAATQNISALQSEIAMAKQNQAIAQEVYDRRAMLGEKGYASHIRILEDKQRLNDLRADTNRLQNRLAQARTALQEAQNRQSSLNARHRDEAYERLSAIAAESSENVEMIHKLTQRYEQLTLYAPTDGTVKGLHINTVGSVIGAGQTILEIMPLHKTLDVEVKIDPKDIGHVHIGQSVQVKLSSYDFSRYGFVSGTLAYISAGTFTAENGERYYQGRITLDKPYVGNNPANSIIPGMTVMADIITGEKTILQYLLKPIHLSLQTAFNER